MKNFPAMARVLAAALSISLTGFAGAQQAYPNKPIRIIVPFPPGGATTILARLLGQKLTESWGQQAIVDNRPGANGIIGAEALVKSTPDGYSILLVSSAHVINPLLVHTTYDVIKDFAPVATLAISEQILVINPSVPANNLQEFIALAKSKPGQLNYATAGAGNVNHLTTELFNIMTGVKTQHIPYKGTGPAITDLIGGQVQLYFGPPSPLMAFIKSGKLKTIAISGGSRLAALPQVPTFTEAGLQGFDGKFWFGILAPTGTPGAITDKLSAEISRTLAMPDFKEKLDSLGLDPYISTPAKFATLIKADMAMYSKIIKATNIKLEN